MIIRIYDYYAEVYYARFLVSESLLVLVPVGGSGGTSY